MSASQFPPSVQVNLFSRSTIFTSSGTFTHPDGYAQPRTVLVRIVGGGGGGGSGGVYPGTSQTMSIGQGLGGGSGYLREVLTSVSEDTPITIGAGGAGGTNRVAGAVTFGIAGASGGQSGFGNFNSPGGEGGSGGASTYRSVHQYGGNGGNFGQSSMAYMYAIGVGNTLIAQPTFSPKVGWGFADWRYDSNVAGGAMLRQGQMGSIRTGYATAGSGVYNHPIQNVNNLNSLLSEGGFGGAYGINSTFDVIGNVTANTTTPQNGRYQGGMAGTCYFYGATNTTLTAGNGGAGTMGSGGGGGGFAAAPAATANTQTSGAGGAGGNGYVEIFY